MEMLNKMVAPILTVQQNTPLQPEYCHLHAHTNHDCVSDKAVFAHNTFLVWNKCGTPLIGFLGTLMWMSILFYATFDVR